MNPPPRIVRPGLLAAGIAALAFMADADAQDASSPTPAAQQSATTVAEDAALLEKGRISSRKKALLRLGASADPAADAVLLAQFKRYEASELPPAIWLELFEAAAKRNHPELNVNKGTH